MPSSSCQVRVSAERRGGDIVLILARRQGACALLAVRGKRRQAPFAPLPTQLQTLSQVCFRVSTRPLPASGQAHELGVLQADELGVFHRSVAKGAVRSSSLLILVGHGDVFHGGRFGQRGAGRWLVGIESHHY